MKYGAEQVLRREYGEYVVPAEPGFDFSVMVDLENLPAEKGISIVVPCYPVITMLTYEVQKHATTSS